MSDAVALDLFIQDFVSTNKLRNQHNPWLSIVNRSFLDDGLTKVFQFQSGGEEHFAVGRHLALPDSDWFRIELVRPIPVVDEHRFDCLRLMHANTHTETVVEKVDDAILVKLTTRHRGLVNIAFVIRPTGALRNPFLVV
jgi:hypothetical protein